MAVKRDNVDRLFNFDVLIDTRTILIADAGDGVDDQMANNFLKAMHVLERDNASPVSIMLKSLGGCIFNGMAIFDSIASSACHVTATVFGSAMSMGAVILQAADERVMQPHSLLMIHDGVFAHESDPRSFENWGEISKQLRRQVYDIFAQRTGKTVRYWEKRCQSDYILTPQMALKEGLIDRIVERPALA